MMADLNDKEFVGAADRVKAIEQAINADAQAISSLTKSLKSRASADAVDQFCSSIQKGKPASLLGWDILGNFGVNHRCLHRIHNLQVGGFQPKCDYGGNRCTD